MIGQLESCLRTLSALLNRSEWAIRLLGLSQSLETETKPGLIMIQIDGLAHKQIKTALAAGRMPFLRHLLTKQNYSLHPLYSGLPASTPAVQGELFYGLRCGVPAFSFKEHHSGRIVKMYDPSAAAGIEQRLSQHDEPLLKNGSAYSDIYTGGAEESHFCPASLGWGKVLRFANPLTLLLLILSNGYSFLRTGLLLIVEFFLALNDCITGLVEGRELWQELQLIPTRVGICILLRELITIGAKVDIARGLPIIHLNFLGYDEQAHRRGPSSLFAHWALQGIDDSIARLWRAGQHARRRNYELWVYSDHGQEKVLAYPNVHGQSVQAAVTALFFPPPASAPPLTSSRGIQSHRVRFLGGQTLQKIFPVLGQEEELRPADAPVVLAMGSLGLLYAPTPLGRIERHRLAWELVKQADIPLVLVNDGPDTLLAWTPRGQFTLPADRELVFGPDHPFLEPLCADLLRLSLHPDAGDFLLSGWRLGKTPYTFVLENGAHAGPGPQETGAFALLPADTWLPSPPAAYLRHLDLRQAALHLLGRSPVRQTPRQKWPRPQPERALRVMTYNVHTCVGMDGKLLPERIARVIAQYSPDIVALQELDVGRMRTGFVDQVHLIAQKLEMDFCFHPSLQFQEGYYGNAVLSHLPLRKVKAGRLPGLANRPDIEVRGALWVAIATPERELQLITTHLGLRGQERLAQGRALIGPGWLAHPACREPIILCGDLNTTQGSPVYTLLTRRLTDAQTSIAHHRPLNTFFGRYPLARIDHVFVSPKLKVRDIAVPRTALAKVASDHLPLVVDLIFS